MIAQLVLAYGIGFLLYNRLEPGSTLLNSDCQAVFTLSDLSGARRRRPKFHHEQGAIMAAVCSTVIHVMDMEHSLGTIKYANPSLG